MQVLKGWGSMSKGSREVPSETSCTGCFQPRRNTSEVALPAGTTLPVDMGHVHVYLRTKGPAA